MTVDTVTRAAIADLNARVAWALDLHDWTALRNLLTSDVHYMSPGREFHDADFHDTYTDDARGAWRIAERIIVPVFRDDTLTPPRIPGANR